MESMPEQEKDVERFLVVGNAIMFHTEPNRKDGPRHKTVVRGWRKGDHILLDRPKSPLGGHVPLTENQPCVMRFLIEGRACAFDSYVLNWEVSRQHPCMRIRWPKSVQFVNFRKFERLRVQFPCNVQWADGGATDEEIHDISIGGCRIHASRGCPEGSTLGLTFALPDGARLEELKSQVCSVRQEGERYLLGCRFTEGQEYEVNDVAFFVTSTLDRQRFAESEERAVQRILIMDDNEEIGSRLKRRFEQRGFETLLAGNVVDGLCRLRLLPPCAVMVSQTLKDLPGLTICRIIRNLEEFKTTLLYLYGGEDRGLPDSAREIGVDGYFPPVITMAPDMVLAASQALAQRQPKVPES